MTLPRSSVRAVAGAVCALWASACAPAIPSDPLVARCGEVARYEEPAWSELRIADAQRDPSRNAVQMRVEATLLPEKEAISEHVSCTFEGGERPRATHVVVGDRTLDAKELALVNSELLLLDLGGG
jgi:hypothetical protein